MPFLLSPFDGDALTQFFGCANREVSTNPHFSFVIHFFDGAAPIQLSVVRIEKSCRFVAYDGYRPWVLAPSLKPSFWKQHAP